MVGLGGQEQWSGLHGVLRRTSQLHSPGPRVRAICFLLLAQQHTHIPQAILLPSRSPLDAPQCRQPHPPCLPPSQLAGSQDVCGAVDHAEVLSEQQLAEAAPDVVVFALCGLSLQQSVKTAAAAVRRLGDAWGTLPAAKAGRVAVVDGEHVFSRPGPLLVQSMEALVEVLHPEAQPYGHEGKLWRWLPAPA